MKYDKFAYLWPPRPEQAVPSQQLSFYKNQGYIAQVKKNGTCTIVAVSPQGELTFMNRHDENHKLWKTPNPEKLFPELVKLKGKGWYYFIGELLHSKVKEEDGGARDTLYLFDILVDDGEYLVGETQAERYERLQDLFLKGKEEQTYSHYVLGRKLWLARQYKQGFPALYDSLTNVEDEGLVLKNPRERLKIASRQKANIAGQVKCRKLHKNFSF